MEDEYVGAAWVCSECGASTPDSEMDESAVDEATGWWNCPECGAVNGFE